MDSMEVCDESPDVSTPALSEVKDEVKPPLSDKKLSSIRRRKTLRCLIDRLKDTGSRDLQNALYDVKLTNQDVADALMYASKKQYTKSVQMILQHPFYNVTMCPSPAQTRSLWNSAISDDPSSLSTTLAQHSFSAEELRDVLLEAGRHRAYRFLDQYVRHPKVCVDVCSASGENILTILLHQLQKNKFNLRKKQKKDESHEDAMLKQLQKNKKHEEEVLKLIHTIGDKVKEEHAEREDVDPTMKEQRQASKNVKEPKQKINDEREIKLRQHKCIFAKLGEQNRSLHMAVRCESLAIVKSLMKYRDEIIHTPILDESPKIDLISTALKTKNLPMINYILSHATCFFTESMYDFKQHFHTSVAEYICSKSTGFSEEERSAMLECIVASASPTNKLTSSIINEIFEHGPQSSLQTLIAQKFSNVVPPKYGESHSFQYLLRMAYRGKPENLRLLLAQRHEFEIDINCPTFERHHLPKKCRPVCYSMNADDKLTLLQVSIRLGEAGVVQVLLEGGADTKSTQPYNIPLICHNMYHRSNYCLNCLMVLLRYDGCDLDQTFVLKDNRYRDVTVSLLDYYLICSDIFMVQMLFELGASKFNLAIDRSKFTKAHTRQIHHLKSRVSNAEIERFKDVMVGEVHTLDKLCRNVVRKALGSNVEKKIQSLLLPPAINDFLNLKELDDMQEKFDKFMECHKKIPRPSHLTYNPYIDPHNLVYEVEIDSDELDSEEEYDLYDF